MQYFTIFQDKLHSVNIQDDQSWAFSETVQKISKITYTASQFSLLTSAKFAVNINRDMLQHNKEIIMFIFLFKGLYGGPQVQRRNKKSRQNKFQLAAQQNKFAVKWNVTAK